jgi:N-formylglutamate amidohydrolase
VSPVVLHVPHASQAFPEAARSTFLPDDDAISRELLLMTDAWTDEIVESFRPEAERVIFPVSRLVVDPERFRDDRDEPMAAQGMGATYTRLSTGEPLRFLGEADRQHLLETYYDPHHARLERAVADALSRHGGCLIIDVHSFSSNPLPHEPDRTFPRPEICIGFDQFHSPFSDDGAISCVCEALNFRAGLNRPFAGSIVPQKYWNADARVRSFMLEIRRDLYMDETTGNKLADFSSVAARVQELLEQFGQGRLISPALE